MSSSTIEIAPVKKKQALPWSLWFRQIRAIFRLEIEKNFLGRRSILLYLLALLPIIPLVEVTPSNINVIGMISTIRNRVFTRSYWSAWSTSSRAG